MLELDGISGVRPPDGSRWKDGGLFRFSVRLVDREAGYEGEEEAPIEDIQSYERFQCFVAREFGAWFRYPPAEAHETGRHAWSELIGTVWGRESSMESGSEYEPEPVDDAEGPGEESVPSADEFTDGGL